MSSHPHSHGELVNENVHHEESDINVRAIVTFVIVLAVVTISIQAVVYGLFLLFNKIEDKSQPQVSKLTPPAAQVSDFPAPSLQTTPWADLTRLRAEENAYLHSYGWIDQSAGVARIPIDRAKALLLQKGLPVRPDPVTDASEGTHYAAMADASGGRILKAGGPDLSGGAAAAAPSPGAAPVPAPPGSGAAATGATSEGTPQAGQKASKDAATKPGRGGATPPKKPGGGA